MPADKIAVLTGDIIKSTGIASEKRPQLLACLEKATRDASTFAEDFNPEIFQGDSFQGYTRNTTKAIKTGMFILLELAKQGFGVRISIAVGSINFESGHSLTSDGSAFRLSGRNLEWLKNTDLVISIASDNENLDQEWKVHSATLNYLLKRCSQPQAEAMAEMLKGKTQMEAAELLKIKQPAVQQRLQAAGWPLVQTILDRFASQF